MAASRAIHWFLESERVQAREKLKQTENELSAVIDELTGGGQNFALIRSKGDQALFGKSTQSMKLKWNVPEKRPLADFAPTIILKAKDFAAEITIHNARTHAMASERRISDEHVTNNQAVRETLLSRGITPEASFPELRREAGRWWVSLKEVSWLAVKFGEGQECPSSLREIIRVHVKDHGDVFGERGFFEDGLDVVGEGAGFV